MFAAPNISIRLFVNAIILFISRMKDRRAADQGHASAQNNLGIMYQEGRGGLPRSDVWAMEWYLKAADQKHAAAQSNLSHMYAEGRGVPRSVVESEKLLEKAAARAEDHAAAPPRHLQPLSARLVERIATMREDLWRT